LLPFLALAVTCVAIAPWQIDAVGASVSLVACTTVVYSFFFRWCFSHTSPVVVGYAITQPNPVVYLALFSAAASLGIAVGATIGTLFELSVAPFLSFGGVIAVCGILVSTVVRGPFSQ
jgi:hypothetical protein